MKNLKSKIVIFLLVSLFSASNLQSQNWPSKPNKKKCYLIGNWRSQAIKNATGIEVYIGDFQQQTSWVALPGQWATDENGVLCLDQDVAIVPPVKRLIVGLNGKYGALINESVPIIELTEEVEITLFASEADEDDKLAVGGLLDGQIKLRDDLLSNGEVEIEITSKNGDFLFGSTLDEKGKPKQKATTVRFKAKNNIVPFYITTAKSNYAYDNKGHNLTDITVKVYASGVVSKNSEGDKSENLIATGTEDAIITNKLLLYRGVDQASGLFAEASAGKVTPKGWGLEGCNASPISHHTVGTNFSIFTSWSISYIVAARFATNNSTNGIILQLEIAPDQTVKSPNVIKAEQEVLIIGPLEAQATRPVSLTDFNVAPADVMNNLTSQELAECEQRLNAIAYGSEWQAMPENTPSLFIAEKLGVLLQNTSGVQAFLVNGSDESPLLNDGKNLWQINAYGFITFNLNRKLSANEKIKVKASYQNKTYEGISTVNYPVIYLKNNPYNLYVKRTNPNNKSEYLRIDGIRPVGLGAVVEIITRDPRGNINNKESQEKILAENVEKVELVVNGQVVPSWNGIPDFGDIGEAMTKWTPPAPGVYIFKPRAYLKDGTVLEDLKPISIDVRSANTALSKQTSVAKFSSGNIGNARSVVSNESIEVSMVTNPTTFVLSSASHLGRPIKTNNASFSIATSDLSKSGILNATGEEDGKEFTIPYAYSFEEKYATGTKIGSGGSSITLSSSITLGKIVFMQYDYEPLYFYEAGKIGSASFIITSNSTSEVLNGNLDILIKEGLSNEEVNSLRLYKWNKTDWDIADAAPVIANGIAKCKISAFGTYALFTLANEASNLTISLISPEQEDEIRVNTTSVIDVKAQSLNYELIDEVDFYVNDQFAGTDTIAEKGRYKFNWNPTATGMYKIYALAKSGTSTISTFVKQITVSEQQITKNPNLLVHWKFDEGSGTTALDSSGNQHDGLISGATYSDNGVYGKALNFNGAGDFVLDDDGENYLNGLSEITLSLWVKAEELVTDKGFAIGIDPVSAGKADTFGLRYDALGWYGGGTNVIQGHIRTTNQPETVIESSNNIQTKDWQHLAMTWKSDEKLKVYINGSLNTPTYNGAAATGTLSGFTKLVIGAGIKDWQYGGWKGLIDDVRIYGKVLSQEEIVSISGLSKAIISKSDMTTANQVKLIATNLEWLLSPNPVQDELTIRYALATSGNISIELRDLNGKIIDFIVNNANMAEGNQIVVYNMQKVQAGLYIICLYENGKLIKTGKIIKK